MENQELVNLIRRLRMLVGDTQQSFAGRLGLSVSAIARYESGRVPAPEVFKKLREVAREYGPAGTKANGGRADLEFADIWLKLTAASNNHKVLPFYLLGDKVEDLVSRAIDILEKKGDEPEARCNVVQLLSEAREELNKAQIALGSEVE